MVRLVFLCLLLISFGSSYGQFMVGPKLGVHAGKVQYERASFKDQFEPGYKIGGNVGAAVTFPVIEPFSLHAELLFTYKGKSVAIKEESLKNIGNYYYIEMPLMMRYVVWPEKSIYLGIGPNLSYWLGGTGKIDDLESPDPYTSYKIYFGDGEHPDDLQVADPTRLQLGLLFGLGKLFKLQGDRMLSFEARYEMGHSFLGKEQDAYIENPQFSDNLESKYRLFSINLGYFLVLHKKSKRRKSSTYRAKQRKG